MASPPPLVLALLNALEEPALLVSGEQTLAANPAATRLLGSQIAGRDLRLAVRHPRVLELVLPGRGGSVEVSGIGSAEQSWLVTATPLGGQLQLVRMSDRSAVHAAERARIDFVANASHELRTPLASIVGFSETLAEDGHLDRELRQRFGSNIHREAQRMLRIVEDLMSLSRIEADRFAAPRGRVSLEEAVDKAAEHGGRLAEPSACRVETEVEPGLPSVIGDAGQIGQLLDNLIANALRYGCPRAGSVVTVSARRDGSSALLSVRDRGEGIAPAHIPRLTQRFYRVDSARSRDRGGTGLGLAIVKHIVERHRGTLEIRSRRGEGTEVLVRLPFA
ncbi:sensor histidine kinase [Sphingomonas sp. GCM10030256]|uniref:sensor histidine kinase n=1 Tax=Sphingomonas sp. GCM10030256 TaxID=3273427 RepID=UPI0036117DF0